MRKHLELLNKWGPFIIDLSLMKDPKSYKEEMNISPTLGEEIYNNKYLVREKKLTDTELQYYKSLVVAEEDELPAFDFKAMSFSEKNGIYTIEALLIDILDQETYDALVMLYEMLEISSKVLTDAKLIMTISFRGG